MSNKKSPKEEIGEIMSRGAGGIWKTTGRSVSTDRVPQGRRIQPVKQNPKYRGTPEPQFEERDQSKTGDNSQSRSRTVRAVETIPGQQYGGDYEPIDEGNGGRHSLLFYAIVVFAAFLVVAFLMSLTPYDWLRFRAIIQPDTAPPIF